MAYEGYKPFVSPNLTKIPEVHQRVEKLKPGDPWTIIHYDNPMMIYVVETEQDVPAKIGDIFTKIYSTGHAGPLLKITEITNIDNLYIYETVFLEFFHPKFQD